MVDFSKTEEQPKKPKSIEEEIDEIIGDTPEMEFVKGNLQFDKEIEQDPIHPKECEVNVFGYYPIDLHGILKINPWKRSIYTTDKLCRLFLTANFEQMKKYLTKKRQIPTNIWFFVIITIAVAAAVVLIFLIGGMM